MRLYVIRHGQSETNVRGCWTGWADVSLTDKGISDAIRARAILEGISFDKIYTSDLVRAIETAKTALPDCIYEATPLLREISVGTLERKPFSFGREKTETNARELDFSDYGGETRAQFFSRIGEFMRMAQSLECDNIAAFSHGGVLRAMLEQVLGIAVPRGNLCCSNCTVAIFEYDGKSWRLHSWINPQ